MHMAIQTRLIRKILVGNDRSMNKVKKRVLILRLNTAKRDWDMTLGVLLVRQNFSC